EFCRNLFQNFLKNIHYIIYPFYGSEITDMRNNPLAIWRVSQPEILFFFEFIMIRANKIGNDMNLAIYIKMLIGIGFETCRNRSYRITFVDGKGNGGRKR